MTPKTRPADSRATAGSMRARWLRSIRSGGFRPLSVLVVLLAAGLAPMAHAGFIDQYPLSVFTLVNSPNSQLTNGSAVMQGDSIVLTGGNSGSGEPGTTTLTTTVVMPGVVEFMYSYFTLDQPNADDAGYLLNGLFFPLADASGASGVVSFSVMTGQTFGFEVGTEDNEFEPGILTISSVATGTPEPGTGPILALVAAAVSAACIMRRVKKLRWEKAA